MKDSAKKISLNSKHMMRINVVGSSASGKSTFARSLANALGIPYIEMDQIFWEPNWTQPTDEIFFNRLVDALNANSWVLDGNYNRTREIKWRTVQTVIWLDYSFTRTLYQSLKRSFIRALSRKELWPGTGNKESFSRALFSKESVILWMISNYSRVRKRYQADMQNPKYSHIQFIRISSPIEARSFIKFLSRA
jgi:adenylate kinase family enzyme